MDPLLKELRENIEKTGATVTLFANVGPVTVIGLISSPRRFTEDVGEYLEERAASLEAKETESPTPDEIRGLGLAHNESEVDQRYWTLRDATMIISAIESHEVPFLRLDTEAISTWWLRAGSHPDKTQDDDEGNGD